MAEKDEFLGAILGEEEKELAKILGAVRGSDDITSDMVKAFIMQKILSKMDDSGDTASTMKEILKMVIPLRMIQPFLEPTPKKEDDDKKTTILEVLAVLKELGLLKTEKGESSENKLFEKIMDLEREKSKKLEEELKVLRQLFDKEREERIKKESEKQLEALKSKLESLEQLFISQANQPQESIADGIARVLGEYTKLRESILKFAQDEGIKKEEIVDKSGKINWGKILTDFGKRVLSITEKYVDAMGKQPPAYQPPVETYTQPQAYPVEQLYQQDNIQIAEPRTEPQGQVVETIPSPEPQPQETPTEPTQVETETTTELGEHFGILADDYSETAPSETPTEAPTTETTQIEAEPQLEEAPE